MVNAGCCNDYFFSLQLDLVHQHGRTRTCPRNGLMQYLHVPIPKKGELGKCDNWWGIALLDAVGNVAAREVIAPGGGGAT